MDKITSFMRVTKKRKVHEKAASTIVKPAVVEVVKTRSPTAPTLPTTGVDEDGELYEHGVHVPMFIFNSVKYARRSDGHKVSKTVKKIIAYITEHYDIPVDFETSHKFGPHSGMTFESRLLRAYKLGLLTPKKDCKEAMETICVTCASLGHSDRDCPDGF